MEYNYKYDLRETVSDLFKCLVYSYLLSFLLLILRTIIASLLPLPAAMMEQLEPMLEYLDLGIPLIYLFIRLGRNYSFDTKSCFKRVAIKGRELLSLCCLDAGLVLLVILIISCITVVVIMYIPEVGEIFENVSPTNDLPAEILTAVVLAPIFEEIVFRGIMLNLLKPHGTRFAILLVSFLFAIGHPGPFGMLSAFIGSILMCHIVLYYQSIWPTIGIHALHNALGYFPDALFVVLFLAIPCFFLYFLIKGDYKKYFKLPMIPNDPNCWASLVSPGKIILVLLLMISSLVFG